jgi:bifunctional enzyme Fae/Hps
VNVFKGRLNGAEILSVCWTITVSKDAGHTADEFLGQRDREEIDQFRVMTDF